MADRGQRVKSIYFPGDREGKGVVAVAFQVNDAEQKAIFEAIEHLGSTELRELLGIADWSELQTAVAREAERSMGHSKSAFLRARLGQKLKRRKSTRVTLPRAAKEIRSAPAGTEDSIARAETYMNWLEEWRRERRARGPVRLIDPFAGTGNFLVAAASRGWESWYCENDPYARLLLELKLAILTRGGKWRQTLRRNLEGIAEQVVTLLDGVEGRAGDSLTNPNVEPLAAAYQAVAKSEGRDRDPLDGRTLRRAIASRKVADLLMEEDRTLGGCFEVAAAWAAASCASPRIVKDGDFERYVRFSLSDFEKLCHTADFLKARPRFLCEDARDLASFDDLGLNAVVTTLPAFEATSQNLPPAKVRAWMLRQSTRGAGGTGVGSLVRSTLDLVRAGSDQGAQGEGGRGDDPRGLSAAEVSSFLFEGKVPRESYFFVQLRNALGREFDGMRERILHAEQEGDASAPTLRRAGMAAVRYFTMIAQVLEGLLAVRDRGGNGGLAIVEVAGTRVVDTYVDTPKMIAKYLDAVRAVRIDRKVVERRRVRGGEGETRAKEVLVYGFPEDER